MAAAAPSLQHAGGANGDDRNILACFAGVPGSGKTTLGAQVQANISNCTVLSVDSAFNSVHTAPSAASSIDDKQPPGGGGAEEWHLAVRHVQQQCKQLLCEGSSKVIIIDDTLHLPSMRKVFFNLARQGGHKFVTIHLELPLSDALERVAARGISSPAHSFVSRTSIENMHNALSRASTKDWEKSHFHIIRSDQASGGVLQEALQQIQNAQVPRPAPPLHKSAATAASKSQRHIADQYLRRAISSCLRQLVESGQSELQKDSALLLQKLKSLALADPDFVQEPNIFLLLDLIEQVDYCPQPEVAAAVLQSLLHVHSGTSP